MKNDYNSTIFTKKLQNFKCTKKKKKTMTYFYIFNIYSVFFLNRVTQIIQCNKQCKLSIKCHTILWKIHPIFLLFSFTRKI